MEEKPGEFPSERPLPCGKGGTAEYGLLEATFRAPKIPGSFNTTVPLNLPGSAVDTTATSLAALNPATTKAGVGVNKGT